MSKYGSQGLATDGGGRPIEPVAYEIESPDGLTCYGWHMIDTGYATRSTRNPIPAFVPIEDGDAKVIPTAAVSEGDYVIRDVQPVSDVL